MVDSCECGNELFMGNLCSGYSIVNTVSSSLHMSMHRGK
jgi:hypothetical protein